MNNEEFIKELNILGIEINSFQQEQLEKYYNMIIEENKFQNLTRIVEKKDVYLKHFYDSLTIVKVVNLDNINTLCDVGTGAGFPGIVLKIIFPNINITLVESKTKKTIFLNKVIQQLQLNNIKVINDRAENIKEKYDIVVSRAVARIDKLCEYTMHLLKKNGIFIAMKANFNEERQKINMDKLNQKYIIKKELEFNLPIEKSIRTLVVIKNKS